MLLKGEINKLRNNNNPSAKNTFEIKLNSSDFLIVEDKYFNNGTYLNGSN